MLIPIVQGNDNLMISSYFSVQGLEWTNIAALAPLLRKGGDARFSFTAKYWLFVGVHNEHKC